MKALLSIVAGALMLAALLATVGGVPVSSVLMFTVLTLFLLGTVFVFDLT
jgi:hypothetical protein